MTSLSKTEQHFLALIRAALSGGDVSCEDADWAALFTLASQQKLLPILFEQVRGATPGGEASALFAAAKQQVIAQVLGQLRRTAEFSVLYPALRAAGLHPLLVKGPLCSRLYPMEDHRISADHDLLIPDDEMLSCHTALLEHGLVPACPEEELSRADEVPYTKPGSPLYLELHRRLFDSSDPAQNALNHLFLDVPPIEADGVLTLPPHEHLLYLLLHAYKHFIRSGIGLRQFCDIGLWAQAYQDEIDWPRLYTQCQSVQAEVFAAAVFRIGRETLGLNFTPPAPWGDAPDAEPLLHDALCGGVYGSNDLTRLHSSSITLHAVTRRTGHSASALAALFPGRRTMERQYPYVKKSVCLLPIAWVQRGFGYLRELFRKSDSSASGSLRLGRERLELMKRYGAIR